MTAEMEPKMNHEIEKEIVEKEIAKNKIELIESSQTGTNDAKSQSNVNTTASKIEMKEPETRPAGGDFEKGNTLKMALIGDDRDLYVV